MITNISDRAMLVGLSIKQFSPTKTDKQLNAELAAKHGNDANMTRVARSLIGREHLDAIRSLAGSIREEHYRRTLPWSDDGSRILTAQGYADYQAFLRTSTDQFNGLVDAFLDKWPSIVDDARVKLNGLFNPADYPGVETVRVKFDIRNTVRPVPTAEDFRVDLTANEIGAIKAQIDADTAQTIETAMKEVWSQMRDVVAKMVERLNAYNPANPKEAPFRDSLVGNISELLDILPSLNLTGDPKVAQFADDMRDLCRFKPQELRDDMWKRADTAKRAQSILDSMSAFVA